MIGGVTRHILPHLPGVPHLHVNRPLITLFWEIVDRPLFHVWKIYTSQNLPFRKFQSLADNKTGEKSDESLTYCKNETKRLSHTVFTRKSATPNKPRT